MRQHHRLTDRGCAVIYLDNNATTRIDERVVAAMRVAPMGNAASPHRYGQDAKGALIEAKRLLLTHLGGDELLFTSGGTEALNMVIRGVSGHIITSSLEHAAVLEACRGCDVTFLTPSCGRGALTVEEVKKALRPNTALIALMAANNETGVLTDLQPIADLGIPLLIDAVALLGKGEWSFPRGMCAAAFSAHKVHGPQGIGCLVYQKGFPLKPLIRGGKELRGGTENVVGAVGFAKAVEVLERAEMAHLHAYFEEELAKRFDVVIHGQGEPRLENTTSVAFLGADAELLLMQLDLAGIAVSYGAACASGSLELSHVLRNMGVPLEHVRSSLRFSLSRETTRAELEQCLAQLSRLLTPTDFTPKSVVSSAVSSR